MTVDPSLLNLTTAGSLSGSVPAQLRTGVEWSPGIGVPDTLEGGLSLICRKHNVYSNVLEATCFVCAKEKK